MPTRFFGSLTSSFECISLTGCRGGFTTTLGLPTVAVLPSVAGAGTMFFDLDFDTCSSNCAIVLSNFAFDARTLAVSYSDFFTWSLMNHSTVPYGGLLFFFPVVVTGVVSSFTRNVFGPGVCSTPSANLTLLFDFGLRVLSVF